MKGVDLLVIQPTPFCNINCSYCYLPERTNSNKITLEVFDAALEALIKDNLLNSELSIVWHAGEPLVLPPAFYKPFFELAYHKLQPRNVSVSHSIQTNGTLITQEWCDFITEHSIKIGVSIDGPQPIHDANRKTRSGKGTFDKVMAGITLLKENKIKYHGIAVVSEFSLNDPEIFFEFFYTNGFYHLGLNIEEVEGIHHQSSVFADELYDKVVLFYTRLFELYMKSDRHMAIREFDRSLNAILRNPGTIDITRLSYQNHQNIPLGIISIDYRGNFSSFSPELIGQPKQEYNDFIFGNVKRSSFLKPERVDVLKKITSEIKSGIQKCKKECEFFHVCGGGAPANKYFENGSFGSSETKYCQYNIKVPTELVLSYLEEKFCVA